MSSTFDVEWTGDSPAEIVAALDELEEVLDQRLDEAMQTAVVLIESTAKEYAPVDTGRLRSSIASDVVRIANDVVAGYVGTNVSYAKYQEFGTAQMDANPFLRPAIEAHRGDVRQLFRDAVDDAIEQVS